MKILAKVSVAGVVALGLLAGASPASAQTVLGGNITADNAFYAYLSTSPTTLGTLIASGNNWLSTFSLPSTALAPGTTYYLNIEAINYGLEGGLIGDFTLSNTQGSFSNGGQELLTNTANWTGSYNNANSNPALAQPWVTPTGTVFSEGANGVSPWGNVTGVGATAQWIWATDGLSAPGGLNQGGVCPNCTVDFSTTITTAVPEPETYALMLAGLGLIGVVARRRKAKQK